MTGSVNEFSYKFTYIFAGLLIATLLFAAPATAAWGTTTVDSSGTVGALPSLALDPSGNPTISYLDTTNGHLKYTAWDGSAWHTETVDGAGYAGEFSSLALDGAANPRISYYDGTNGDLKYAAWNGIAWQITTVESTGDVGMHSSLALEGGVGNPRISYYDFTNTDLRYAAWDGSAWHTSPVDRVGSVGEYSSLALDAAGNPRISYYDATNGNLKYAAWDGSAWQIAAVDSTGDVGEFTSLAVDTAGNPRISYYDATNRNLKYAVWDGSAWQIETVDSTGDVGEFTSLALDTAGNPRISYYDATNGNLKYAAWDGSAWQIAAVDSTGNVGGYTSLALDASQSPRIGYYDYTNGDLKYASAPLRTKIAAAPVSGPAPLTVTFTGTAAGNYKQPTLWAWTFGDGGVSDQQNPTHTYTKPGTYTVSLAAYDTLTMNASSRTALVTVTDGPAAAGFTATPTSGPIPLEVRFTDTSTGPATAWSWDFGDGSTSAEPNPVHHYYTPGTYTVAQTVTNHLGTDTETKNSYITVSAGSGMAPIARFTADVTSGPGPLTVKFTDTSVGSPTDWDWDFGDGDPTNATAQNPVHTYAAQGVYDVVLNVNNAKGGNIEKKIRYVNVVRPSRWIPAGGRVLVGESGIDISGTVGGEPSIAFFPPGALPGTALPEFIVLVSGSKDNFNVAPAIFGPRTGKWYRWNVTTPGTLGTAVAAFTVIEPNLDLEILDASTGNRDVTGKVVPVGEEIGFRVISNIADLAIERHMPKGVTFNITLTAPDGSPVISVVNKSGNVFVLNSNTTATASPHDTVGLWDTGRAEYPPGTYTARVKCNFNGIMQSYVADGINFMGKTNSGPRIVTIGTTGFAKLDPPTSGKLTPDKGNLNDTVLFTITGKNFVPDDTLVEFRNPGTGALLNTTALSLVTENTITGTIVVPADAVMGPYIVRIATGIGETSTTFTVTRLAQPKISGVTLTGTPNPRTVGLPVTIRGENFQDNGKMIVNFFNETSFINVTTIAITPKLITGTINIPTAPEGDVWRLRVITFDGGASVPWPNAMKITGHKTPTIASVILGGTPYPRTVALPVTIKGDFFEEGKTIAYFFNGTKAINVTPLVITQKQITGTIDIPTTPAGEVWKVRVYTEDGGGSLPKTPGMTIAGFKPPTIASVTLTGTPYPRTTGLPVTIKGDNYQGDGKTIAYFFNGTKAINVTPLVITQKQITGTIDIPTTPAGEVWKVRVYTEDGGGSLPKTPGMTIAGFKPPTIASVTLTGTPYPRTTALPVTIKGDFFEEGKTIAYFFNGTKAINVTPLVITQKQITGTIDIPTTPAGEVWKVRVYTEDGGGSLPKTPGMTIVAYKKPSASKINPDTGTQGSTVTFTITGDNFQPDKTAVALFNTTAGEITTVLTSVTVKSITGRVAIPDDAATGTWGLNITTDDGGKFSKPGMFKITRFPAPTLTSVSPATGYRGTTVSCILGGKDFQSGGKTTVIAKNMSAGGATINMDLNVVYPTQIAGSLTIPADAVTGTYQVIVTTDNGGKAAKSQPFVIK